MKIHKISPILLIILLISSWSDVAAQRRTPENLPKYDLAPYHFGFILGLNQMHFTVKNVKDFERQDSVYAVLAEPEMGFHIGIVSNLRLGDYWDLRFIPSLAFGERSMVFTRAIKDTVFFDTRKKVESTYLDFPFYLKYKSKRLHNARAYVISGFKYSVDLASQAKKKEQDEEIRIKLKKNDVAFEFGVGFDFYTTYFKFGTEIKMSYGLRDILKHEANVFTSNIQKLNSKIFQFTLTFE
ncbi:MAG TPA: porin family protein [Bacteroidales bacterium]|nr:porin family protein [Bacteroidales bacterium]HSA43976.1 porin family protein [Bacteroidales bacterium]